MLLYDFYIVDAYSYNTFYIEEFFVLYVVFSTILSLYVHHIKFF